MKYKVWHIFSFHLNSNIQNFLLNTTLKVPSVGFSVAGLDRAKFGFYRFQSFLFIVVIVISTLVKLHFDNLQFIVNHWWKFCSDRTRIKSLLRWLENIGMVLQKLYRNTLINNRLTPRRGKYEHTLLYIQLVLSDRYVPFILLRLLWSTSQIPGFLLLLWINS